MSDDTTTEAIESTTEAAPNERDTLIAAVESAKGEAPLVEAKSKEKPAESAAEESPSESKVAAILRAREEKQAKREFEQEMDRSRSELAAMRAETERMQNEAKVELARLHKLKTSPLEAIKEIGWDRKQLVDEVVREGSPEWQAQKRYEAALEEQRNELNALKAWKEEQKAYFEKQEQERAAAGRQQVEKRFIESFPEDSAARTLYDESELVAKGHAIADAYREKSGGQVASIEEIRDYLEEQSAKRLASIRDQQRGPASAAAGKNASQPKANGPRALSGSAASEKRTSPKPRQEWTPDDEYAALKAAAESAMK